jgi:AcrR family transcriptional regulator
MPRVTAKPASRQTGGRAPAEPVRRGSHAERRVEAERRMISAAVKLVAERGLDSLTLAECGEAAGYSRGLAAHYFGSKDALTAAIATRIVEQYVERQREARTPRDNALDGLIDGVVFYMESGPKDTTVLRAFHAVLGAALNHSPLSAAIAALNRNTISAFVRAIRYGMARGEIRSDVDPVAQASLIVAALRGVMTQWLLDRRRIDLEAIKREFVRDLYSRLAPDGAAASPAPAERPAKL